MWTLREEARQPVPGRILAVSVPDAVSVACLDDPDILSYCYPAITTMRFDYLQTGMHAAQMIIDCINGKTPKPDEIVMPFKMQVRESTRAL